MWLTIAFITIKLTLNGINEANMRNINDSSNVIIGRKSALFVEHDILH